MKRPASYLRESVRRGYALLFAFVFIFIIGMAALPAVLMANGHSKTGTVLYRGYHFLCHQYPWRSWFLKGAQRYYPLRPAENSGMLSIQEASGLDPEKIDPKNFFGTPEMGYKMAICQRDTAIYGAMAIFAVLFFLSGNRIPPVGWKLWLIFGIFPVGLDGGTQLLGGIIPGFPFRESTPLLRSLTGFLFGLFTCWFLLPVLERSLQEGNKDACQ